MITLTEQQLIDGLVERAKRGCFVLTIEARTDARARKTDNPIGRIYKRSKVNGLANWIYANAVNRQRAREFRQEEGGPALPDIFRPHKRSWGIRIHKTPLVMHDGKTYLELKVQRSISCTYETFFGAPLTLEEVEKYLPDKRDNRGRQGVENPVIIRDYAIEVINSATLDGVTYKIDHQLAA